MKNSFFGKVCLVALSVCFLSGSVYGKEVFKIGPPQPVVDLSGQLSRTAVVDIENNIFELHNRGGTQIAVVLLPNLRGWTIEQAALSIAEQWKLGDKIKDDGVLLLVSFEERQIRIEVGRGREGDLPDAYAKRIISDYIAPNLKAGDVDRAITAGVMAIIQRTDPGVKLTGSLAGRVKKPRRQGIPLFYGLLFILSFVILPFINYFERRRYGGLSQGGRIRSSRWRGGGGGFYGGGGGFGGGGFGGGGGSFGGGGASGRW